MDKGSKKTKKKGKSTDPKTVKRMFGVAFFAFGLFLLVALVFWYAFPTGCRLCVWKVLGNGSFCLRDLLGRLAVARRGISETFAHLYWIFGVVRALPCDACTDFNPFWDAVVKNGCALRGGWTLWLFFGAESDLADLWEGKFCVPVCDFVRNPACDFCDFFWTSPVAFCLYQDSV